jgi:hypothetical protein
MFRAYLRPSSGGRTAFYCLWFHACYSCYDAGESGGEMRAQCTTITGQKTIGSETQSDLLTMGVKTLETY